MLPAVRERLRRAGHRVTKQRIAVYTRLSEMNCHATAEEVYEAVRLDHPDISLATVYKALDSLADIGIVRRIHRGRSAARYDPRLGNHAHFRCLICDGLSDIPFTRFPQEVGELADVEVIGVGVEFFGYCLNCRRWKLGLETMEIRSSHTPGG